MHQMIKYDLSPFSKGQNINIDIYIYIDLIPFFPELKINWFNIFIFIT